MHSWSQKSEPTQLIKEEWDYINEDDGEETRCPHLASEFVALLRFGTGAREPLTPQQELQSKKRIEIVNRMHKGDKQAIVELGKFDPVVVARTLARYAADHTTDPELSELAIQTMRGMPGLVDYYRNELAKSSEKSNHRQNLDFGAAAIVGGDEMAKIVAPYLFDETPPPPPDESGFDVVVHLSNRSQALLTLRQMHRPGDPDGAQEKFSFDFNRPQVEKWRHYLVREGLVDRSIIKKFPGAARYFPEEKPTTTPSEAPATLPQTRPNETSSAPATPALTATAATPTRKLKELTTFDIVVFSIFGLAAAAVIFFGLRTRKRNQ
jgi:hypothetical protein